jgi:hypothetical protein
VCGVHPPALSHAPLVLSSSPRTLWWCWPGAGGACLLCLSGLCGGGTRRRVGAPRTENYLELRAAEGAAIRSRIRRRERADSTSVAGEIFSPAPAAAADRQ